MHSEPEEAAGGGERQANGGPRSSVSPIVVGIGGSAGALPALMSLLKALDGNAHFSIVVVLHLAPDQESSAADILQRASPWAVSQVQGRTALRPGHVYVIAPGMNLITEDGYVQPGEASRKRPSSVIDIFFRTLGDVYRERAVGIVLSGTGRDGALGLSHIKENGGLTIVQATEECEHDDMPKAAIATGSADLILRAAEIGKRLVDVAKFPRSLGRPWVDHFTRQPEKEDAVDGGAGRQALQDILAALRVRTRHDFRHYKSGTVMRRLQRRMQVNEVTSLEGYRDYVRQNPEELGPLLADMLISVTNFFRDPQAFETLQRDVMPALMEGVSEDDEVRVWIPACASGEEAYSVAILLREHIDQMPKPPRVQIFASDINEAALHIARAGVYPANIAVDVSDSRLLRFFEKTDDDHYRVRSTIRESIVFARHNLLGDPPFSRLDLICCRNLLIYLDRTAQEAAFETFAYALKPNGYLFLGNAESVDSMSTAFQTVSKEHRIYKVRAEAAATARAQIPSQLVNIGTAFQSGPPAPVQRGFPAVQEQPMAVLHDRALVQAAPPNVLINANYEIERVSSGAGRFVTFGEGVPTRNLLNNVGEDIRVELRAALFRAGASRSSVQSVFRRTGEAGQSSGPLMALSVHPVASTGGDTTHWLVLFDESAEDSNRGSIGNETGGTDHQSALRRLEDENRSLKMHLQDTLDRSAVSNEELKASNEELQAINEELRSAKEELETSKEELQSVNEELSTVNFELRMKVEEAGRNNDDLRNLIEASEIATVFVDPGMRVKRFTPQASKLFALIPSDIGRPLMDVKSRLRYDEIVADARTVFDQLRPIERSITSIDDEHFFARILPYRTSEDKIGGAVLTFVNVTELRRAEHRVRETEERLRDAIATSKDFAVISTDTDGAITTWNEGATRLFGHEPPEIIGQSIDILFTEPDRAAGVPAQERRTAAQHGRAADERWHVRRDGSSFFCSGVMTPLHGSGRTGFVKIARDISESKQLEIRQSAELTKERRTIAGIAAASELKDQFLAVMSHELKQPLNLIQVNAELLVRLPEAGQLPAVRRIGDTIMRSVSAQDRIVNDLLDLSRIRTGKMRLHREATDLVELVQQLSEAIRPDAVKKDITLEIHAAQPLVCYCDTVRIEQVVWNLLANAVKFTPGNGRIEVTLSAEEASAKLEVKDTGVGIAAEYLLGVFDLFNQGAAEIAGARRAGLGIGLALARDLVHEHGGRIEAQSSGVGQGATFTVWLPLMRDVPQRTISPSPSTVLERRILVVDDDIDSLTTFAALLEMEGASVDTATSASAALNMLATNDYDLLLSDVGMPEMSGIELMEKARELRPAKQFRSIAISGFGRETDVQAALAAGFDAHLTKPVTIEGLKRVLQGG